MSQSDESNLWRVSEFERDRQRVGNSVFAEIDNPTVLSTTLMADLYRIEARTGPTDVLEVAAACMRHRESAVLCLQHMGFVWPLTLFPADMLYHSPRDITQETPVALVNAKLLATEAAGVRPPGHWMHERVARTDHYRPLQPLLWELAIHGPRTTLLSEISSTAAYRALRSPSEDGLPLSGAMGSAAERMRRETASLRSISSWPGMTMERASRLLNGLYLVSAVIATRAHPAAAPDAESRSGGLRSFFGSFGSKTKR
jgi:hypothetical protein